MRWVQGYDAGLEMPEYGGKNNHASRMLCVASKEWAKRKESCDQKPREGWADMKYDPGRSIWNWFRSRE